MVVLFVNFDAFYWICVHLIHYTPSLRALPHQIACILSYLLRPIKSSYCTQMSLVQVHLESLSRVFPLQIVY